ncbi:hypothetical protein [Terribacillus saccharophilus]
MNGVQTIIMLVLGLIIMVTAVRNWLQNWNRPDVALRRESV